MDYYRKIAEAEGNERAVSLLSGSIRRLVCSPDFFSEKSVSELSECLRDVDFFGSCFPECLSDNISELLWHAKRLSGASLDMTKPMSEEQEYSLGESASLCMDIADCLNLACLDSPTPAQNAAYELALSCLDVWNLVKQADRNVGDGTHLTGFGYLEVMRLYDELPGAVQEMDLRYEKYLFDGEDLPEYTAGKFYRENAQKICDTEELVAKCASDIYRERYEEAERAFAGRTGTYSAIKANSEKINAVIGEKTEMYKTYGGRIAFEEALKSLSETQKSLLVSLEDSLALMEEAYKKTGFGKETISAYREICRKTQQGLTGIEKVSSGCRIYSDAMERNPETGKDRTKNAR